MNNIIAIFEATPTVCCLNTAKIRARTAPQAHLRSGQTRGNHHSRCFAAKPKSGNPAKSAVATAHFVIAVLPDAELSAIRFDASRFIA